MFFIKSDEETYYQRNEDVILKRAKDHNENDQKRLRDQAREINTELYLKKKKIKRNNMEERDTIMLKAKRG